jgi:hypothetical protein
MIHLPIRQQEGIVTVTCDLHEGYRSGFHPHLDHARQVADPFHVVATANRRVDQRQGSLHLMGAPFLADHFVSTTPNLSARGAFDGQDAVKDRLVTRRE